MSLPIYNSIDEGIRDIFGNNVSVTSKSYVGGGDINDSSLLTLSDGERVFLKANSIEKADFFRAEESGINAIAKTGVINVPELLFRGTDSDKNVSYLCMRYISAGDRREDFWEDFGHKLAKMHLSDTKSFTIEGTYGFTEDNYIGATYQLNESRNTWCEFFRDCRLKPQLKMADRYFDNRIRNYIDRLLNNLPSLLSEPTTPSLIHGDLWSGNYMVGNDGNVVLIDPAVYVGHAEADLAMTELFGRFPQKFYDAYSEVNPIDEGYGDRRDLYNLYHLLNHLNLFGVTYLSAVVETIRYYS